MLLILFHYSNIFPHRSILFHNYYAWLINNTVTKEFCNSRFRPIGCGGSASPPCISDGSMVPPKPRDTRSFQSWNTERKSPILGIKSLCFKLTQDVSEFVVFFFDHIHLSSSFIIIYSNERLQKLFTTHERNSTMSSTAYQPSLKKAKITVANFSNDAICTTILISWL